MSAVDGLIVLLPDRTSEAPAWKRVVDGAVIAEGTGTGWLEACGLDAIPAADRVMLVAPASSVALHWLSFPDLPVPQGRAAARLAALETSIGPVDALMAAADMQHDPAHPHIVAVVARADVQHWLLWAQHHGLDPDAIVPAPLLLPEPEEGFAIGAVGRGMVLRGPEIALAADGPVAEALLGDAVPVAADLDWTGALADAPLNLRQGDFLKRRRYSPQPAQLRRIAVWIGCIALASLAISLLQIARYRAEAGRLEDDSLSLARTVLPAANDPTLAEAELAARLAARGSAAYSVSGPAAGLLAAMQGAPEVSLTALSRGGNGVFSAQLSAPKAADINTVLLALQGAGYTITATSPPPQNGRTLADITVQP